MEAVFKRQEPGSEGAAFAPLQRRVSARQLHRRLPRLGSAIAEEGAVQTGPLGQPQRQFSLALVVVQVGNMHQFAALAFDSFKNCRVPVSQCVDANSAEQIKIPFPFFVDQIHARPVDEQDRIALVGRQQQLGLRRLNRFELHATITSVP